MKRVFTCIGFSVAIALIVLNLIKSEYVMIITIGLALALGASLILREYRQAVVVPLCLSGALLACLLFLFSSYCVAQPQIALDDKTTEIVFYATEEPITDQNGNTSFEAETVSISFPGSPQNIRLDMFAKNSNDKIEPFNLYKAKVKLGSVSKNAFSSKGKWADNIFLKGRFDSVEKTGKCVRGLKFDVYRLRKNITEKLLSNSNSDAAALSVALVTGNKSYLNWETRQAFSYAGASHIMAVSGLHLSVATGFILFVLRRIRASKRIQGIVTIIISLFYMSIVGFTGSITRAGIMLIVLSVGMMVGRRADALNSLGVAVLIMCLNPYAVCDVGAILSVIAVLSILIINPHFSIEYDFKDPLDKTFKEKLKSSFYGYVSGIYTTVIVSFCTLPVMYMFFGYISIVAPLTNLVVIPLGSLSMMISLGCTFVDLSFVADFINGIIIGYVKFISSFSASTVNLSSLDSFGFSMAGIFLVFALCFFMNNKKLLKLAGVISISLIVLVSAIDHMNLHNKAVLYFSDNGAYVLCYEGYTIVGRVGSYEDYDDVRGFLSSHNNHVDYLISDSESGYYSNALSKSVRVDRIVAYELDDYSVSCTSAYSVVEYNKFNLTLAENFKMYYNFGVVEFDINSLHFTVDSVGGDIVLSGTKVYDKKGIISLEKGDVAYIIDNEKSFNSRRINKWQD